jgi:sec-independent protein translocase protein TatB
MFGIGGSEVVIIALLFLLIFGPNKLPQMARDIGKFVGEARRSIDEFKEELTAEHHEEDEKRRRGHDDRDL